MSEGRKFLAYWIAFQGVLLLISLIFEFERSDNLRNMAIGGLLSSIVFLLILFRVDRVRYD